jgi:hypothetical protein
MTGDTKVISAKGTAIDLSDTDVASVSDAMSEKEIAKEEYLPARGVATCADPKMTNKLKGTLTKDLLLESALYVTR